MNKDIDAKCEDGAEVHLCTASEEGLLRVSSSMIVVGACGFSLLESGAWWASPGRSECYR
jgi:hypothetical protein